MADELAAARLQLIIFSAQGLKDVRLLGRTRTSVLAWVDPALKQATAAHRATTRNPIWNQTLIIPLSAATLSDPSSTITLQLLCCRPASTAAVHLRAVRNDGRVFTLPLERPPGRCRGFFTVSAHIFSNGCIAGVPMECGSKVERLPRVPPLQQLKGFFVGLASGAAAFLLASRVACPS